jgi:hypothetical protein
MTNENLERLRAHRNNARRYRRLLATRLSNLERTYIERRLSEEQASVEALLQETFPDRLADTMIRGRTTKPEMATSQPP